MFFHVFLCSLLLPCILKSTALNVGLKTLWQGSTTYGKLFLMAHRSSMFHILILLWLTEKVCWPWIVWKYVCCWNTELFKTFKSVHS